MIEEKDKEQTKEKKQGKEEKVKVPEKFKDLVQKIEELNLSDLAELVKVLKDKFGLSALPMAVVPANAGAVAVTESGGGGAAQEKDAFDIELKETGGQKIAVIKVVKEIIGQGLKEAKDLVDGAPKIIKQGVKKEEAEEIKKKLEEAGAVVELK